MLPGSSQALPHPKLWTISGTKKSSYFIIPPGPSPGKTDPTGPGRCLPVCSAVALRSGCYVAGRAGGGGGGRHHRRWSRRTGGTCSWGRREQLSSDHRGTRIDNHRFTFLPPPNTPEQSALSASGRRNRQHRYKQHYQHFSHLLFLPSYRNHVRSRDCRLATLPHKTGCASATDDFLPLFLSPPTPQS